MEQESTRVSSRARRRLARAALAFAGASLLAGCGGDAFPIHIDFANPGPPAPYLEELVVDHGGSVAVIDAASSRIVKTIAVGKVPGGAVTNSDATFVYFPDSGGYGRVGVVDGASDERLEAVRIDGPAPVGGGGTRQAVYAKAGKLLYSTDDFVDDSVSAIDTTINAVGKPGHGKTLKHIVLGGEPLALATNAAGTRVYVLVAKPAGATIAVIDATVTPVVDQVVTEEFALPACAGWSSLAAHPDDATLYTTCADGLGIVDVRSGSATRGTVLATLALGSGPGAMALVADSRLLVLNEGSGQLAIVDVLPGSPTRHTIVASLPSGGARYLALGSAAELYVADPAARTMTAWLADASASNGYVVRGVVALPHEPSGIGVRTDGGGDRVYVSMSAEGAAQISMFDGVFPDGSWTSSKTYDTTAGAAATFSARQEATGGMPQFFRHTTHTWTGGAGFSAGLQVAHLRNFATLPAGSAIDHIDWSFDDKVISQQGGTPGFATFPLLRQGGNWFQRYDTNTAASWTHHDYRGLTENDFINASAGPLHPDFSPAGGAIEFGYGTANGTSAAIPITADSGIDNWTVTVTLR